MISVSGRVRYAAALGSTRRGCDGDGTAGRRNGALELSSRGLVGFYMPHMYKPPSPTPPNRSDLHLGRRQTTTPQRRPRT